MGFTVIIAAAGQGKRMEKSLNKIFIEIEGETVIRRTVSIFQSIEACTQIFVAAHPNEVDYMKEHLDDFDKVVDIIPGGKERQHSIREVLKRRMDTDIVMTHDAARPFVKVDSILASYDEIKYKEAVILGVRAKDTVKKVIKGIVQETPNRSELWQIQTPQTFKRDVIVEAYNLAEKKGYIGTDDASVVEQAGYEVHVVESDYTNIKITTEEDLIFAKAIIQKEKKKK